MTRRRGAIATLVALLAAGAALVGVELGLGAAADGEASVADPCVAEAGFSGDSLDATVQRIALSGLNGAACELGTTREELVLSFVPEAPGSEPIEWDRETIERAVRAGLLRAIDDAERGGSLGSLTALVLRELVGRAPIDWLLEGAVELGDLIG